MEGRRRFGWGWLTHPRSPAKREGSISKISHVVPEIEWPTFAPPIAAINALKREKNAVILGHNYMTPEIFHCVARFHRRQPRAGARGGANGREGHRAGRRAFHGRDVEDPLAGKDRADPRSEGRLFARRLHHRRRCAPAQAEISRPAGGDLCEHLRRREGGKRYLLHVAAMPCRWSKTSRASSASTP